MDPGCARANAKINEPTFIGGPFSTKAICFALSDRSELPLRTQSIR